MGGRSSREVRTFRTALGRAGGVAGLTVTALIAALVVRHYLVGPPWRTLLVVGSVAAVPALVFLFAFATLMPVFGLAMVALVLLLSIDRAFQALAARDR